MAAVRTVGLTEIGHFRTLRAVDVVVGREAELERVASFLAAIGPGPAGFVVDGHPGIGKTTLWRTAVHAAREQGMTVLACRPVDAEAPLAFAGLTDLLAEVADDVLAELPPPQRQALAVALRRAAADDERIPVDPRAVSAAVATGLRHLARHCPVLLAIDDVPWLDTSTSRVVSFALRRLSGHPVGVLVARRTPAPADLPLGLDTAFTDGEIERLELRPLSLGALHRLITAELGRPLPRPLLVRVERTSGGNPLFALEIARALDRAGVEPHPSEPLPVPARLRDLLADRLAVLAPAERHVLLLVAASANATEALIRRQPGGAEVLGRAEQVGLVELEGGRVRFTHPLLAATLYGGATEGERRAAHRRLAETSVDPEDQARHIALAVDEPDASVADALERAADSAGRRGASAAATELLELAVRRTPDPESENAHRRRLALARHLFRDGDASGAGNLAAEVRACARSPSTVGEALLLLAEVSFESGGAHAAGLCTEALGLVGDDAHLAARVHAMAGNVEYDDFKAAAAHARRALALLDRVSLPDPRTTALALQALVQADLLLGLDFRRRDGERAVGLERIAVPFRVADRTSAAFGAWLLWVDEFDEARRVLERTWRTAIEEGDDSSIPYAMSQLSLLELRAGNWDRARSLATECLEVAEAAGQDARRGTALHLLATVDAYRGDVEQARAEGAASLALARDDAWDRRRTIATLGFLELSLGDLDLAQAHLEEADALARKMGLHDPGHRRDVLDLAEVLIARGDLDRASHLIAESEQNAVRLDRPASRAKADRCRGLVRAASGDLDGAIAAYGDAIAQHERVRIPFDEAQTHLARGQVERRWRHKKAAQQALQHAHDIFEALGARLWLERTRSELARVGLRAAPPGQLTPTERRVAELAADGLTNRQIGSELHMSPKTVEGNLGRAYAKLHIRSRAELGRVMDALGGESTADRPDNPPAI